MEWEGVRHPFRPDRVYSSRLLWPMYYVMHVMNDMSNMLINQITQIYLWMRSLLLFKKFRSVLVTKKIDFGL